MNNKILITRPNHDQTVRYIGTWAEKIKKFAEQKGYSVLDLKNEKAEKKNLESMLKRQCPGLIFFNGHGSVDAVAGQDNDILVKIGDDNKELFEGKIIYSLSCSSGKELGPALVGDKAKAFIGYKEDFIFTYDERCRSRPKDDKIAEKFLDPSNQVMVSLLKGHEPKESCLNAKRAFLKNIRKMLSSQSSSLESSSVRYLIWDMQNLVCLE